MINAKYTLGRNTGNTFQQTYRDSTVQGVPIKGPNVGMTFPPEDYVALPISNDQLYITWLDPNTFAIVDVFVMNFKTHTVYDYAPGSATQKAPARSRSSPGRQPDPVTARAAASRNPAECHTSPLAFLHAGRDDLRRHRVAPRQ